MNISMQAFGGRAGRLPLLRIPHVISRRRGRLQRTFEPNLRRCLNVLAHPLRVSALSSGSA